jgi:radical SAM superfamily enzyme YgiQ (UPF0313 family)
MSGTGIASANSMTHLPLVLVLLTVVVLMAGFGVMVRKRWLLRRFVQRYHARWSVTPKRHKVLIISPTLVRNNGDLVKQGRLMLPALNVALLAGLTPDDWDVEIIYETIEDVPYDTDADLIAISAMGVGLWRGLKIADEFRARGKQVVLGGPMATLVPERVLDRVDAVCVGEGEAVWERILRDFERGELRGVYKGEERCTPSFPVPRYDLLAAKKIGWFLPVQAGRGCPHRCEFCSIAAAYHGRYRRRPVEEIVRDIKAVKSLGYSRILLLDDNIAADKSYALELFAEVEKLDVQWMGQCALSIANFPDLLEAAVRSGCTTLSFGLETVNQASLESVNKRFTVVEEYERALQTIRAAGIDVSAEMILGMDGDGPDTFDRTADFVLRNRITLPRFYVLTPIPGTPLFERMEREGRIIDDDFGHYNASQVVFQPARMSSEDLQRGYWRLYDRVFAPRSILTRVFGNPMSQSLLSLCFLLGVNLHYRGYVRRRICPGMV